MSSAEATTKACSLCLDGAPNMMPAGPEIFQQIDGLRQEVTRLKCDKLDLLRQNVVCEMIELHNITSKFIQNYTFRPANAT